MWPLGLFGRIAGGILSKIDKRKDTGKSAVIARAACIAVAAILYLFFGAFYLDTNQAISRFWVEVIVKGTLFLVIIGMILTMVLAKGKSSP